MALDYIHTGEGRIRVKSNYTYDYYLKDHLGNTRVVFADTNSSGIASTLQLSDYYPFGMTFKNPNQIKVEPTQYLYNGKELQEDFGLNLSDYGARMYDGALGRFMTMDNYSEKYFDFTPYQYAANNPICNIDINGDSIQYAGSWDEILQFAQTFAKLNVGNISLTLTKDADGNVDGFKSGDFTASEFGGELGKHFETVINSDKMVDLVKVGNTPGKVDDLERYGGMKFNVSDNGKMSIQMTDQWFTGKWKGSGLDQPSYNYTKTYSSIWKDDDTFSRRIPFAEGFAHEMVHASRYISGKGTRGYAEENAARGAVNAWREPRGIEKRGILKVASWGEWINNGFSWDYEKLHKY
jgi:RHS repeat-associated protein